MDKKRKNKIAVIVISAIFLLYMLIYMGAVYATIPFPYNVLWGVIPAALAIAFISVSLARIKEIESDENDDLDKY